jgi:hypothetical protein
MTFRYRPSSKNQRGHTPPYHAMPCHANPSTHAMMVVPRMIPTYIGGQCLARGTIPNLECQAHNIPDARVSKATYMATYISVVRCLHSNLSSLGNTYSTSKILGTRSTESDSVCLEVNADGI